MTPTYPLDQIKSRMSDGRYFITVSGTQGALRMGFDTEDILECICEELRESHFYKTMPAEKVVGLWQDVYRLRFRGYRVYLKLQMNVRNNAVVISFKEDTSR